MIEQVSQITFRKAMASDAADIVKIITQAQLRLFKLGVNQWQNGYPNLSIITRDIELNRGYVLSVDDRVMATAAVSFEGEPTYVNIYQGAWLDNIPYAVVHRLAVGDAYCRQGLSAIMLNHIADMSLVQGVYSIRVDTHPDNQPMRRLLDRQQFKYCGVIHLADGDARVAYEKLLKSVAF